MKAVNRHRNWIPRMVCCALISLNVFSALPAEQEEKAQQSSQLQDEVRQTISDVAVMRDTGKCKNLSDIRRQIKEKPEAADLIKDIDDTLSQYCKQKMSVPPSMRSDEESVLHEAINSFYGANYDGAQKKLKEFVESSAPHSQIAMALAYFFIGTCDASQYYSTGDSKRLEAAKLHFAEARKLFKNTRPPLDLISSRIANLYQNAP